MLLAGLTWGRRGQREGTDPFTKAGDKHLAARYDL